MITYLVDTNIFLRPLLNDVPSQTSAAKKLIKKAKEGKIKFVTSQIIVFEVIFALSKYYGFEKSRVVQALDHIVSSDYFNLESRKTFVDALEIYKNENLDFTDCFLIAKARIEGQEILTFDKKLQKYAKNS